MEYWALPGWHWMVITSGTRSLVSNPGVVVNPDLLWWGSPSPGRVQREPATEEVVRHQVREEDNHVHRYMATLDTRVDDTWQILQGSHPSYARLMVPSLWVFTSRGLGIGSRRPV